MIRHTTAAPDHERIDFADVSARALAARLHRRWCPGRLTGHEWTARNPTRDDRTAGSFSVNELTGQWCDFATGDKGGDLTSLRAYLDGSTQLAAAKAIMQEVGGAVVPAPARVQAAESARKPPLQVASDAQWAAIPAHPVKGDGAAPTACYRWRDAEGRTLFAELRWAIPGRRKEMSLGYYSDDGWVWGMPEMPSRPPYNLDLLAAHPDARVVWTEGPKAAQAVMQAHGWQGVVATTGAGGAASQGKTDWSALAGRRVTIWPDRDAAGRACARSVSLLLQAVGASVDYVHPPAGADDGWDAADATQDEIMALLAGASLRPPPADPDPESGAEPLPMEPPPVDPHEAALWGSRPDWPTQGKKPPCCIPNVRALLQHCGATVAYDQVAKRMALLVPGIGAGDCHDLAALETVRSLAQVHGMPVGGLDGFVAALAWEQRVNPVADWVRSREWDGVDRIGQLAETLRTDTPDAARILLRRWMVSAVALAMRGDRDDQMASQGMLVLQSGAQGVGKSRWLAALGPSQWVRSGVVLRPAEKDSLIEVLSRWIVALDELDATMATPAAAAAVKAFVTRPYDELRLPYDRRAMRMPRRTVFAASVNKAFFLSDPTGNRRFWTLSVSRCDPDHGIDMQQAWAQARALQLRGETHYPTVEESALIDRLNAAHTAPTATETAILGVLEPPGPRATPTAVASAVDVLRRAGYQYPTTLQVSEAMEVMRAVYGPPRTELRGRPLWHIRWRANSSDTLPESVDTDNPMDY